MLEKNVTELDKDFMILYSKYILSNTLSFGRLYQGHIDNEIIVKLIKLGQLNALQLYCKELYNDNEVEIVENSDIHKILDKLESKENKNYNELYALSCNLLDRQAGYMNDQYMQYVGPYKEDYAKEKLKQLKEDMDGYKYMDEAIKQANKLNDEQPNLLLECFIYDMFLSSQYVRSLEYRYQLYKHDGVKWIRNEYLDEINKYIKVKEKLKQELKKDPKNEVLAFTLARCIVTLSNFNKASTLESIRAKAIFSKFAQRRYSSLLISQAR